MTLTLYSSIKFTNNEDSVPCPRAGHIAVLWNDWLVVWGGFCTFVGPEDFCKSRQIFFYHVDFHIWKRAKLFFRRRQDRLPSLSSPGYALLGNDLYIIGGYAKNSYNKDLFTVNLKTLNCRKIETCSTFSGRDKFGGFSYKNSVFFFGGYGEAESSMQSFVPDHDGWGWHGSMYKFDVSTSLLQSISCVGKNPSPRAAFAMAQHEDIVYLFGGRMLEDRLNDFYSFHIPTLTWTFVTCCHYPPPRSWCTLSFHNPSQLLLQGGMSDANDALSDFWLYDIPKNRWTCFANWSESHLWHTAVSPKNSHTYVFGGFDCLFLNGQDLDSTPTNLLMIVRNSPPSLFSLVIENFCFRYASLPKTKLNKLLKIISKCGQDQASQFFAKRVKSFTANRVIHYFQECYYHN